MLYHSIPKDFMYYHVSDRVRTSLHPLPTHFNLLFRQQVNNRLLRPRFTHTVSIGILTDLPSLSPFGLGLGPD